jgi:broad specificity phosphatase PhoE
VLLRHSATEPGVGDPPGFDLKDCSTQRNLSGAGRAQARNLGRWFQSKAIVPAMVRTSPWCRARETAELAFGRSEDWQPLSNLFGDRSAREAHVREVREAIAALADGEIAVFVSHGISIDAFIGVYLAQGEFVVVRSSGTPRAAGIEVVGRLLVP